MMTLNTSPTTVIASRSRLWFTVQTLALFALFPGSIAPLAADPIPARKPATTANWPSYGLDYAETRFSTLRQVNNGNIGDLGLLWTYNLESTRGVEATPLVVVRNLGYVSADQISQLEQFVFNGPHVSQGMPDFTGKLTREQVEQIKAFIQGTADSIRPK